MSGYDDDIIIHPQKSRRDTAIPSSGVFCVTPSEAGRAIAVLQEEGAKKRFLHNSKLVVSGDGSRFVAGPAIGAPAAALIMEKLIVLGGNRIYFIGWCGAIDPHLKIGDIVVPTGAISGEGTSAYYTSGVDAGPSVQTVDRLHTMLEEQGLEWHEGKVWSTDAPYRESRRYMTELKRERQVVGVDMEFSALCSVAAFRNVEFGGVLIVSDELFNERWRPGFKDELFQERCRKVLDCLLHKEL